MPLLFSPFKLANLSLSNRVVIPPMCQYSAVNGCATAWHSVHLGGLALGNPGLLILEATGVVPEGRISPFCLGLWDDKTEKALSEVIAQVRLVAPSVPLAIQLAHAGRKASVDAPWRGGSQLEVSHGGWQTVSASNVPFKHTDVIPHALTQDEIQELVRAFAMSTQRAVRIGFNAIELHAAHGYLLHQFLSPISNQRDDEYGGCVENRMRFLLEVVKAVKEKVPTGFPVGVRLSATDWLEGQASWEIEQSVLVSKALADLDVAWIHVSSGGLSMEQQIPVRDNYQVPFAKRIKQEVDVPVITVGLITKAGQAEAILKQKEADLVAVGRAVLFNPRWVWEAAGELGARLQPAPQFLRCEPRQYRDLFNS